MNPVEQYIKFLRERIEDEGTSLRKKTAYKIALSYFEELFPPDPASPKETQAGEYFLVYQLLIVEEGITKTEETDSNTNIDIFCHTEPLIRIVEAVSEAEAIGKFVMGTQDQKCKKKIEPIICYKLSQIKRL